MKLIARTGNDVSLRVTKIHGDYTLVDSGNPNDPEYFGSCVGNHIQFDGKGYYVEFRNKYEKKLFEELFSSDAVEYWSSEQCLIKTNCKKCGYCIMNNNYKESEFYFLQKHKDDDNKFMIKSHLINSLRCEKSIIRLDRSLYIDENMEFVQPRPDAFIKLKSGLHLIVELDSFSSRTKSSGDKYNNGKFDFYPNKVAAYRLYTEMLRSVGLNVVFVSVMNHDLDAFIKFINSNPASMAYMVDTGNFNLFKPE